MSSIGIGEAGSIAVHENALRKRYVAHTMRQRGTPLAVIADHLNVEVRSVSRYLAKPCPKEPPPDPVRAEDSVPDLPGKGACAERPDLDFFSDAKAKIVAAKAVCAQCPVLGPCRDWGLTGGIGEAGIVGGLTRSERRESAAAAKGVPA